ncbi:MAG: DUF4249 domain-containing protein [Bacteroidetes bacterium]|nr:DUF4249 domain-containing protein [Bacteroidota bacterium]
MNRKQLAKLILLGVAVGWGCKKHYTPKAVSTANSYLVVEGMIAAGSDSTIITLSRTVQLTSTSVHKPEAGAKIAVDDQQGGSYPLPEVDSGKYAAPPLNLDNSHKYRLDITTADGQTYVSDYVPVKVTPPVDTISTPITANGLSITVSTHDASNNTRYYRWDYTETFIYQSDIEADYIFDPTNPDTLKWSRLRTPAEQIHTCYVTLNSSIINVNSSAALKQDLISNNLITQIPKESEKIVHRYSILVKQYALTQDAYNFWSLLKSNTQNIGTIFDAQPSVNQGNIHCTSNPSLPVIGYVSASTIAQKRIFIDRSDLPVWPIPGYQCNPDPKVFKPNAICWRRSSPAPAELNAGIYIPLEAISTAAECYKEPIPAFTVKTVYYTCADCRFHLNGKTHKPSFWK